MSSDSASSPASGNPGAASPASSASTRPPAQRSTVTFLGCAFTVSFLLNLLCGGVVLFSCFGLLFNLGSLSPDLGAASSLTERTYAGNASSRDKIAIISLDGVIMEGLLGFTQKQIEHAAKDKNVKAVVFRINSPGGSITASDDLYRRLVKLRDGDPAKKYAPRPLIVSMASLAASGGYYVAMPAQDNIFAERTTMTGSIGVYAAFPNLPKGWWADKFDMITIKQGEIKASGSPFHPMSGKERAVWQDMVNQAYNQFLDRVEEGRKELRHKDGAPREEWPLLKRFDWQVVKAGQPDQDHEAPKLEGKNATRYLADGGIYTAEEAKKHHLIDRIGTLDDAIKQARDLADLEENVRVVEYEKPKTLRDLLLGESATKPASVLDPAALKNGLAPRIWLLAPGFEMSGMLAAAQAE
jgi:protease-4